MGAGLNVWGARSNPPPIRNSTWAKGILVIERSMGVELN